VGGFGAPGGRGFPGGGFSTPNGAGLPTPNGAGLPTPTGRGSPGAGFGLFGAAPGAGGPGSGLGGRGPSGRPAGAQGGPGGGGIFGGDSPALNAAIAYAKAHGGGTIGVSSQSTAAAVILSQDANVAGLGGFSGRESSVSASWIAMEVREGRLRWVIDDAGGDFRARGDTRTGSAAALAIVAKTCKRVTARSSSRGTIVTMYDCRGLASAILAAARQS
jgi:hypothetical protein